MHCISEFSQNSFCFRVTDDGLQTRAHLETQLAASLALKSPQEYRQCLLSYIRFLARLVMWGSAVSVELSEKMSMYILV